MNSLLLMERARAEILSAWLNSVRDFSDDPAEASSADEHAPSTVGKQIKQKANLDGMVHITRACRLDTAFLQVWICLDGLPTCPHEPPPQSEIDGRCLWH